MEHKNFSENSNEKNINGFYIKKIWVQNLINSIDLSNLSKKKYFIDIIFFI